MYEQIKSFLFPDSMLLFKGQLFIVDGLDSYAETFCGGAFKTVRCCIHVLVFCFEEHLRRHTGETPFLCTDCPQRFKTRNTYKRHLRTRHGKLLLANGIHIMSRDEFLKVRTKPYLDEKTEEDAEPDRESAARDDVGPQREQQSAKKQTTEEEIEVRKVQQRMKLNQERTSFASAPTLSRKPAILCRSSLANRNLTNGDKNILSSL